MFFKKIIFSKRVIFIHQKLLLNVYYSLFFYRFNHFIFNYFLSSTKRKLDSISPAMCSAKWLQSTLHLELAETHSCHHPKRHSIDIEAAILNPSKLHNTEIKINARREMLKGIKTKECSYCWKMEECNQVSDRIYKSSASWAETNIKELTTEDSVLNIEPHYLEVSFSSTCNLKCAYCYPEVSSAIRSEYKKFGPYPTILTKINTDEYENKRMFLKENNYDVQLENSFFEWWDKKLKYKLKNFRITGGEPLLNKNTFRVLDELMNLNNNTGINFAINSNLIISEDTIIKLCEKVNHILKNNIVESFEMFTSIDTWGESAAFLRHGLDLEVFKKNCHILLSQVQDCKLIFMVTYQFLSPFEFNDLGNFVLDLRKKYPKNYISLGISKLMNPLYLSLEIDPAFISPFVEKNLNFMKKNIRDSGCPHGFSVSEIKHLERIYLSLDRYSREENINKYDFKLFIDEYCVRKSIMFENVFVSSPELISWYEKIVINR